jgi:hypothetical protein
MSARRRAGLGSGSKKQPANRKSSQCGKVVNDGGARDLQQGMLESTPLEEHYCYQCPTGQSAGAEGPLR